MKPPLLSFPSVGSEDSFPGELLGPRQWVIVNEQRIIHPVELDSLAEWRIDNFGLAQNCSFMATNILKPVKCPHYTLGGLLHDRVTARRETKGSQNCQCRDTMAENSS